MSPGVPLHVDPGHELPIYRQLVRQISDAIAGGRLADGEQLPSHRDLATRLVIAPLTVKKAYDELEKEGLLQQRRGLGSFVRRPVSDADPDKGRERLRDAAERLLSQAALVGVPFSDVIRLLEEVQKGIES